MVGTLLMVGAFGPRGASLVGYHGLGGASMSNVGDVGNITTPSPCTIPHQANRYALPGNDVLSRPLRRPVAVADNNLPRLFGLALPEEKCRQSFESTLRILP